MHEYSIACEIWRSVMAAARAHGESRACPPAGLRVRSVTVEMGDLNLIEAEQLRFWLGELGARDGSPGVELEVKQVAGRVRCRECGEEAVLERTEDEVGFVVLGLPACPKCGSRNVAVIGGRELRVVSAQVDLEEHDECGG